MKGVWKQGQRQAVTGVREDSNTQDQSTGKVNRSMPWDMQEPIQVPRVENSCPRILQGC